MKKGLVYVFTGEGKGKTSAAIGTAVRAVGAGMSVVWVAFYKQKEWKLSEATQLKKLGVEVYIMGKGFHINKQETVNNEHKSKIVRIAGEQVVVDTASEKEHKQAAEAALELARQQSGKVNLIVLDEVNNALQDKLINLNNVVDFISNRKHTHLVLTGRDANAEIIKLADLVTEMRKVKHPYDGGALAVKGLDF